MTATSIGDPRILDVFREVVDNATVGKVFGPPITQGETTVLPVAKVGSGAGGGTGTGPAEQGQENGGTGGGFGLSAKALGVFVLQNGRVRWHPAVDVNKVIIGGQLIAVTALLVARSLIKARSATSCSGGRLRPIGRRRRPAADDPHHRDGGPRSTGGSTGSHPVTFGRADGVVAAAD